MVYERRFIEVNVLKPKNKRMGYATKSQMESTIFNVDIEGSVFKEIIRSYQVEMDKNLARTFNTIA